jgi:transposase-like protein
MSLPVSEPSALSALTARQAQVAVALAQGATITAAAAAAGVNRVTVHRWLHTPAFAEAVRQTGAAYILALRDESKKLRSQALAAVDSLLTDPQSPAEDRLRLAVAILEHPLLPPARPPHARQASHPGKCNEMQQGANGCNAKTNLLAALLRAGGRL